MPHCTVSARQDLTRADAAVGVRPTENTQIKLQYSIEHLKHSARDYNNVLAGQFTLRF